LLPASIVICFAQAAPPAPAPKAAQVDADGDDPREELLYHWQDIRFSRDEQRQTIAILVGLAALKLAALARKARTRKQEMA
jgi:hypothetical protein